MAPVKILQIKSTFSSKLSIKAKNALIERDLALSQFKESNNQEDLRHYRNLKNLANSVISKEKYARNIFKKIKAESSTTTEKWKKLKRETGQASFQSPQIIVEGSKHHTSHKAIADSLNRQYVRRVNKLIEEMGPPLDPLISYSEYIGEIKSTLTFKKIAMSEMRLILMKIKGTNSMGQDDISLKSIKQA